MNFRTACRMIWPVAFITMGCLMLAGVHLHFSVFGLKFNAHILMWFMMGLAHADIFWRKSKE